MTRRSPPKSDDLNTRFIDEYLIDFDHVAAAIRAGIPRLQAKAKSRLMMQDGDILIEIRRRVDAMQAEEIATPNRILAGLMREAGTAFFNKDRIAALKEAHAILQDSRKNKREDKEQQEDEERKSSVGGGVMRVPGIVSLDEWEAAAQKSQGDLKKKVRE